MSELGGLQSSGLSLTETRALEIAANGMGANAAQYAVNEMAIQSSSILQSGQTLLARQRVLTAAIASGDAATIAAARVQLAISTETQQVQQMLFNSSMRQYIENYAVGYRNVIPGAAADAVAEAAAANLSRRLGSTLASVGRFIRINTSLLLGPLAAVAIEMTFGAGVGTAGSGSDVVNRTPDLGTFENRAAYTQYLNIQRANGFQPVYYDEYLSIIRAGGNPLANTPGYSADLPFGRNGIFFADAGNLDSRGNFIPPSPTGASGPTDSGPTGPTGPNDSGPSGANGPLSQPDF